MKQQRKIYNAWDQLTVKQYERLQELHAEHKDNFTKYAIEMLYGVPDADNLPLRTYGAYVEGIMQMGDTIQRARLSRSATYEVNGRRYQVDITPSAFTVAQYIDLTNGVKEGGRMGAILASVMVPVGHTYNDGYDMKQVRSDMDSMPCTVGFAVVNFFHRWLKRYIATSRYFLTKWTKKIGKKKESRELATLLQQLKTLTASFPTC